MGMRQSESGVQVKDGSGHGIYGGRKSLISMSLSRERVTPLTKIWNLEKHGEFLYGWAEIWKRKIMNS